MDRHALYAQLKGLGSTYPGHDKMPLESQYLLGCRNFPQFCSTFRTIAEPERFCVFCDPMRTRNQPFAALNNWYIKESDFPVKGTCRSLLIIPRRHMVPGIDSLTVSDGIEVFLLFEKARQKFCMRGGGLALRFGDSHWHAGTIPHAHFNVLEPTGYDDCEVTLGKTGENWAKNFAERLYLFILALEDKGGLEWLFSPEGIEATKQ